MMKNYTKKIVVGAGKVFVMTLFGSALGYIFRLLLAKNLSLHDFGLFFAMFSLLSMIFGFKNLGMGRAFVRFVSEFKVKKKYELIKTYFLSFIKIQAIIFLIIAILVILFSPFLSEHYFKVKDAGTGIILLVVAFGFTVFISSFKSVFQAFQKMGLFSLVDFLQSLFLLIFVALLFNFSKSFIVPIVGYLLSFFVVMIICGYFVVKVFPFHKIQAKKDNNSFKRLFMYSMPIFIVRLGDSVINRVDTVILTTTQSLEQVALYHVALPTALVMGVFTKSFAAILFPISSELYFKKSPKLQQGLSKMYKYLMIFIIPGTIVLFSFSREIISLLYGPSYEAAHISLKILSVGVIFSSLFSINRTVLLGIDKPKDYSKVMLIGAFLSVLLNLILIPLFGMVGASIAFSFSYTIMLVISHFLIKKYIKTTLPWKEWMKNMLIGIVIILFMNYIKQIINVNIYLEMGLILSIMGISYITLILFLRIITITEIKKIFKAILK